MPIQTRNYTNHSQPGDRSVKYMGVRDSINLFILPRNKENKAFVANTGLFLISDIYDMKNLIV